MLDDLLEAIHHAIVSVVANCGVVLELPGRDLVSFPDVQATEGRRALTHTRVFTTSSGYLQAIRRLGNKAKKSPVPHIVRI